jgi:AcrR family transcriptional regulator
MVQKPRRTQAERSEATRKLLLDATIDCLVERGYTNTTTTEIADRAGVSRGAQLHHFPTKDELVTAALDHLMTRRHAEYLDAMARLPEGSDRTAASIDQLWEVLSGPTFYAWLELVVAARTAPALRKSISEVAERFACSVEESFRAQFPAAQGSPFADVAPGFTFALLQGLALENILQGKKKAERLQTVLGAFRTLSSLIIPQEAPAELERPAKARRHK